MSAQQLVARLEWPLSPDSYHTAKDLDIESVEDSLASSTEVTTLTDQVRSQGSGVPCLIQYLRPLLGWSHNRLINITSHEGKKVEVVSLSFKVPRTRPTMG